MFLAFHGDFQNLKLKYCVYVLYSLKDQKLYEIGNIFYWNTNDHTKPESFKNSVTFKSGGINDWMFYISNNSQQNKLSKEYNMPIGKVKGFTFNYKGVDLTFKRTVTEPAEPLARVA